MAIGPPFLEGINILDVANDEIHGLGWDLLTDRDVPFTVDLRTGKHTGGIV